MSTYAEAAISHLKHKGYRVTRPRKLVLELLAESTDPLSAYEIKDRLESAGDSVDTVSVYRILECLEENGLIHRIAATGQVTRCQLEHEDHCHLKQHDHCHHLLLCQQCRHIEEIHCPGLDTLIRSLETRHGVKITGHTLELTGLCSNCAQSA